MKKIWMWGTGVVIAAAIIIYIVFNNAGSASTPPATADANNGNAASNTNGSSTAGADAANGTASGTDTGNMGGMAMGNYKDGVYTGPVTDAIYGKLQLVVTVSNGMITDVSWPVYPNDPGHTTEVSASSLPALKQEAIAAQSANVDIVSGATQTAEAFQQSLAAALAQAKS